MSLHLSHDAAKKRIQELSQLIQQHDEAYYVKNQPTISDEVYDQLFRELKTLEESFPDLIIANSPTQKVAGRVTRGFAKMKHVVPLLSLDNVFSEMELQTFYDRLLRETGQPVLEFTVEHKFDGVSIALTYHEGQLFLAGTRGDGTQGEDVTANIMTIRSLPKKLHGRNIPKRLVLRGEIIFTLADFQKLNAELIEKGEEAFANPRNAASGTLRQIDATITAKRPLGVFIYDILQVDPEHSPSTLVGARQKLSEWGLPIGNFFHVAKNIDDIKKIYQAAAEQRDELPFEIDGLVIKVNNRALQDRLGFKARSPKFAFAYKFPSRKEVTRLEDVIFQVGRTGVITPVALLKPVDIGGVTVARATLHNADVIESLQIKIGDQVRVERAGDVIPAITEVLIEQRPPEAHNIEFPKNCPACATELIRHKAFLICPNHTLCPPQREAALVHFGSKRALNIAGLGEETVHALVESGWVKNASDLYNLKLEDLLQLEGYKNKKAENLLTALQESLSRPLDKALFALGIEGVGEETAKILLEKFQTISALAQASFEALQSVHGIGPETAKSLRIFFENPQNLYLVKTLTDVGLLNKTYTKPAGGKIFSGKTFVLTGELDGLSRNDAKKMIEDQGGKVSSAVSTKTSFVVVGDNPGSKLEKAQKLGVRILNQEEFLKMLT